MVPRGNYQRLLDTLIKFYKKGYRMQQMVILFSLLFFTLSTWATPTSLYEIEPNNTPVEATHFSGEILLTGKIHKGNQDAFMWEISKEDTLYDWSIELIGIPNAMTRIDMMNVIFTTDGKEVEDYQKFFSFGTKTGNKPVYLRNILVSEGKYLLALSSNATEEQSYQIILKKHRKSSRQIKESSKKNATKVTIRYNNDHTYYHYNFLKPTQWFQFKVDKKDHLKLWTIRGINTIGHKTKVKLFNEQNKVLAQSESNKFGKFKMLDLELDEGKYYLQYEGKEEGTSSAIKVYSTGQQKIDQNEVEPNNKIHIANAINYKKTIHGKVDKAREYDYFSFSIPKKFEEKVFDIELTTTDKGSYFHLENREGKKIQRKKVDANLSIKNLRLNADETYYISLYTQKKDAEYSFKFSEFRKHTKSEEIEPNDTVKNAHTIELEQQVNAYFQGDEYDCFQFNIEKPNTLWNITALGEKVERLKIFKGLINTTLLSISKTKGQELALKNLLLLPGNYRSCVNGKNGAYSFSVNEASLSDLNISSLDKIEHEPNQNKSQTNELLFNMSKKGVLEHKQNEDYFHFTLKNYERIRLTATPPKNGDVRMKLISDLETIKAYPDIGTPSVIEGVYPPGRYIIDLWSKKPSYGLYDLKLERLNFFDANASELNITMKVVNANDEVATYSESGQKVNFSIEMESKKNLELNISSHISDNSWELNNNKIISLKSKKKKNIPFELIIPKNIGKIPVVTTLKFTNKSGAFKTVSFKITPKDNAKPLNPYTDWGIPEKMLGGLNVARLDFGAKRILEHKETQLGYVPKIANGYHHLFDDIVYSSGFYLYANRKSADENVTIQLAGNVASDIIGVVLNPFSRGSRAEQLKDFSIALSLDGKTYTHVYKGVLGLERQDQAFAFDKPYKAKYARLTLHNSYQNKTKGAIALGEWKVIAKPQSVQGLEAFNLSSPKLGGHVVKSSHDLGGAWDKRVLTEKEDISTNHWLYKKDKTVSWIVGFKNERMAKITDINWRETKKSKKETYMKNVKVLLSTQTPNGPWEEMPLWNKNSTLMNTYHFEKPTWARYVKFVFSIEKDARYAFPEELQVMEAKSSADYRSIFGEWGETNHQAFYEYQQEKTNLPLKGITGNESKEKSFTLEVNQSIQGRVSVANHEEDWYKIIIPEGHNQFHPTFSGKNSVDVSYELFDDKDNKLMPNKTIKTPLKHDYWFEVEAGTYYLKVKQPPISVVFAWDNSGSVSPYHAKIFSAVNNYTQTIQAKIDAVNLLCFNQTNTFILSDFSDNPMQIQGIFNNFDRDCSDSDAERPLRISSEALKNRDGTKGVIIIGDAVGSRDKKLWSVLEEVKPKVFSIRVKSQYQDNGLYEGIMQSWSRVNNGTYTVVSDGVELYKAINRASAILRRPVYYMLQAQSNYVRPLGDGILKVMPNPQKKVNKDFAIELILDASGSMLKRIKGKRRIAIARDVLKKAVTDIIPAETQVALRVFGHKKADSCRTDLEMRLQPLNVKKTTNIISKINAKNLAKTPIADSLAKVADDLKKVNGKKVVILVTDGEETCDGDPAKEIQMLKDKGVDVRINIVGFAINNEALKAQFKSWAELGDGNYFEADDKESLNEAVKKALQVPYKVYNKTDEIVGTGVVGDEPIKLKGGSYKVVIESSPEQVFEDVTVIGEQMKEVTLKDEK
ncbi:MAG: Unknown protein [uncultured Sulfurovum sp.]|uniref:VWFA domain-containing protein n=1 Tax=uncultured Sulfurovum sp. TaxID=269237 RepID=A0A6S6TGY0_9BACT|nr:MAG: Unknown protein [uncultured Sulfurovum sp.]